MCLHPIRMRNPSLNKVKQEQRPFVDVPCGKCPECLSKRRKDWVFRLKIEYQYCLTCLSFTLTYDEQNVHYNSAGAVVHKKSDVQKFIKLLRYYNRGDRPLKYFIVGEYGDKLGRPHYHCILFNFVSKDYDKDICRCWNKGRVQFGDNKGPAFAYAAKYYIKPFDSEDLSFKPFSLISKGIGLSYLTPDNIKYHRLSGDMSVKTFDGQTYFMPRYLREKIWSHLELITVMHSAISKLKKLGIIDDDYDYLSVDNRMKAAYNHFKNVSRKLHHQ